MPHPACPLRRDRHHGANLERWPGHGDRSGFALGAPPGCPPDARV